MILQKPKQNQTMKKPTPLKNSIRNQNPKPTLPIYHLPQINEKIKHSGTFTLRQSNLNFVQCGIWTGGIVAILTD
jgi:hypothetical protein